MRIMSLKYNMLMQKMLEENVPQEMKIIPNWVCYRVYYDKEKNKYNKMLINPNISTEKQWAKSNDLTTWTTYENAIKYALDNNCVGISFCLQKELKICCIDLDHCIENGKINDYAKNVLRKFGHTYCEKSISGNGLHIFCLGELPNCYNCNNGKIEMYDANKFISMTGQLLKYSTRKLERVTNLSQINIDLLGEHKQYNINNFSNSFDSLNLSDNKIIEKLCKRSNVKNLFDGDMTNYNNNHNVADLALCGKIAFYTKNYEQIDSIFMQSGLYRDKWDRISYKKATICKAIEGQKYSYNPKEYYASKNKTNSNKYSQRTVDEFIDIER